MEYNQIWYNKHFQNFPGITNRDINRNIWSVAKHQIKVLALDSKGTVAAKCELGVADVENENLPLGTIF